MKKSMSVMVGCGVTMVVGALSAPVRLPLDPPGTGTPNFGRVVPKPEGAQLAVPSGFTVQPDRIAIVPAAP
jgi:hypothetical protein